MPPGAKIFIACTRSNKYYSILPKLNSINKLLDLATKKREAPTSKKYVSLSYQKCLREMWRHHSSSQNLKWRWYTWKQHWNISVSFPKKTKRCLQKLKWATRFSAWEWNISQFSETFQMLQSVFPTWKSDLWTWKTTNKKKKLKSNLAYFIICVIIQLSDIIQLLYIEKAM